MIKKISSKLRGFEVDLIEKDNHNNENNIDNDNYIGKA